MKAFECPHCGHEMNVPTERLGTASHCPNCGKAVTVRANQPDEADRRGTAAGPGVNPVVFLVVAAVIIAFAAVGLLALTGTLPFGPRHENATTDLQDDAPTNQQKLEANVPSPRTEPNQEPGDNERSFDPIPDSDGSRDADDAAPGET